MPIQFKQLIFVDKRDCRFSLIDPQDATLFVFAPAEQPDARYYYPARPGNALRERLRRVARGQIVNALYQVEHCMAGTYITNMALQVGSPTKAR